MALPNLRAYRPQVRPLSPGESGAWDIPGGNGTKSHYFWESDLGISLRAVYFSVFDIFYTALDYYMKGYNAVLK